MKSSPSLRCAAFAALLPLFAEGAKAASIQPAALLADLVPGLQGSNPSAFEPAAGVAFFRALDADGTPRLWRTDGSRGGTFPLDLGASRLRDQDQFGVGWTSQAFFFTAFPVDRHEPELWVSDGTQAGTARLASGLFVRARYVSDAFFEDRHLLFFRGRDAEHGEEVWVTDGTPAGTLRLTDLRPGSEGSFPREFVRQGDRLYFLADLSYRGQVWLYSTDGTPGGTVPIRGPFYDIGDLVTARGALYFRALSPTEAGLWRSDGTNAGTILVTSLPAGNSLSNSLSVAHDKLYFPYQSLQHGQELWVSDGTAPGTRRLTDFEDPQSFDYGARVAEVGEHTIFIAGLATAKAQMWGTDGTPAGTRRLVPCDDCGTAWLREDGDLAYFTSIDGAHGEELWRTDGTPEGTRMLADVAPGPMSSLPFAPFAIGRGVAYLADEDGRDGPGAYQMWWVPRAGGAPRKLTSFPDQWWTGPFAGGFDGVILGQRLLFRANDGVHGSEPWVLSAAVPDCGGDVLCLGVGDRFAVEVSWRLRDGRSGAGHPTRLTADTGYFWFFGADNVEVVVKVLDARPVNGHFWVFYGALSDVEYTLVVTDRTTGLAREYRNPAGRMASVADTRALPEPGAASGMLSAGGDGLAGTGAVATLPASAPPPTAAAASGPCVPTERTLCLQDGRFRIEAEWTVGGNGGVGKAVPLTADTGYFWFFGSDNVEVVLKVLDGRPVNDHFWVFYGALSDVQYRLTVTDTVTGAARTYTNPAGEMASRADTRAIPEE